MGRPGPRWEAGGFPSATPSDRGVPVVPPSALRASVQVEYASFFRRLAAFLVDELAKAFVYLSIVLVVAMFGGLPESASSGEIDPVALLPRLLLSVGYDWIFWSQGWTPGTNALGIRIVRPDGSAPGPVRGGIRALVAIPSAFFFFVGYAWMLFNPRKQTWHDLAAGVYVVRVEDTR